MKFRTKALATTAIAVLSLAAASTASASRSYGVCSADALFYVQVGHLPSAAGSYRFQLVGTLWKRYASMAYSALHPENGDHVPSYSVPVACNPALAAVAVNYGKAKAHDARYTEILATFSLLRGNPTGAEWRALYAEAALADSYSIAVLNALGGQNPAATSWTAKVQADRQWLIARAKAVR